MPIYEYECTRCGRTTEQIQHFSDPPLKECCDCHGELRKLISMSTFHLKGSGWYTTDYAGKNQSTTGSGKHEECSRTEKTEGKTDSKTESKTESASTD